MSRLTDLIAKAKAKDSVLGAELDREFKILSSRLPFGLNFERHSPEAVELPLRPIRKGDKVRVLPERGTTRKGDQRLWQVKTIHKAKKTADLELLGTAEVETQTVALDDLVVVAEFRDTIYPGLVSTGRVSHGGDKPFHSVINGENYHVLKALTYTHRGKVDAIYIDPPYNSGAKDWKYNNDYVEKDDSYRHSKWLAMMERRLLVARELLNPASSVLIVTIDEKEYLRLGLLLEQLFPEATFQMTSTVIAPQGSQRPGRFSRIEEYIFCGFFGESIAVPTGDAMIATTDDSENEDGGAAREEKVTWDSLMRRGTDATRASREDMFYPITIDKKTRKVVEVGYPPGTGNPISFEEDPDSNLMVKWPIRTDGSEGRWQLGRDTFENVLKNGMARVGRSYAITYLKGGARSQIEKGEIVETGKDDYGYPIYQVMTSSVAWPRTVWNKRSHNASVYGSTLLRAFIPGRKFPFPKSLYAVEDTLRFFVANKPDAVILDFFSGSGTTAHAVMRLNKEDGGRRQCISVTNNEVASDEQKMLREQGLRPGDVEWEKWGICEHITKPRIAAAITGKTPDGEPIEGDYLTRRTVEKETPRRFIHLGFVEPAMFDTATKKKQLVALIDGLPQSLVRGSCHFIVSEDHTASVLFDPEAADEWLQSLDGQEHITDFYIVTPGKRGFDQLKEQVIGLLGPMIVREEEKLPISEGFEENAEFFTLTYETPVSVNYNLAFNRIAPLLWLRAGAQGSRIDKLPADGWAVADAYGVLNNVDAATPFIKTLNKAAGIRIAYIVTDDDRRFQAIAKRLPDGIEPVRLYESYLTNFSFTNGE
ncbi:DNA methyltransferase [Xanthomonadaceae bacterium JHOS43]|nr:DNA methyltransferase [Xanthomonadaceae bacterium JHOS43]